MKRTLVFALVLVMLISVFSGCAKGESADPGQEGGKTDASTTKKADPKPTEPEAGSPGIALSKAHTAYIANKKILSERLMDLFHDEPDLSFVWDHHFKFVYEDPDSYTFAAPLALGEMGLEEWKKYWYEDKAEMGVEGNVIWVSRFGLDSDKLTAEMIDGDKGLFFTYSERGKTLLDHYEFRPTPSGCRSQFYYDGLPAGKVNHYLIANEGDRWVFGFMATPEMPDRLSGDESLDFPKSAPLWVSVDGDQVLVRTEDGEETQMTLPPPK